MQVQNPLVEFLASYGPQPSSNSLYDEFVVSEATKTGCEPLEIDQPLIDSLLAELQKKGAKCVILTGTAGDGKTYTARQVLERLSGGKSWSNADKIYDFPKLDHEGSRVRFIKDLSEITDTEKDGLFDAVIAAIKGEGADTFVICVNDGHLLQFFRKREGGRKPIHDRIATMLQRDEESVEGMNLLLLNMSRTTVFTIVDRTIDAIAEHPKWAACNGCPALHSINNRCPIRVNLDVLSRVEAGSLRGRLKDLVRMAAADGQHVSIRQLILLCVNVLLGASKDGNVLLDCDKARKLAQAFEYRYTNPYLNAFGENLKERERVRYSAFSVMRRYGIGHETNNHFDRGLLGDDSDLPRDQYYGSGIFDSVRERYLANPTENASDFHDAIVNQRRRLFFSISPEAHAGTPKDPWALSVFHHGKDYVRMSDALKEEKPSVPDDIRRRLFQGINRVMTGEMTKTDDMIWFTAPSGVFKGHEMALLVIQAGSKSKTPAGYLTFPGSVPLTRAPILRFIPGADERLAVDLPLRPTLLECLLRIADGAILASFSSECRLEIERFQLRAAAALRESMGGASPDLQQIELNGGLLQGRSIEVMASERDW
ncbi:hypothetical protein [Jiella sp. M17.18]|uniref:hypothetical protein n=1 Tax=Jiella sp. M17.18 TaxID=3234247 RepID=UPI0034E006B2